MIIHETRAANQAVIEETRPADQLLVRPTLTRDQPVIEETTPARKELPQQSMPANELGLPAAVRHELASRVAIVLAAAPDVRVPFASLASQRVDM